MGVCISKRHKRKITVIETFCVTVSPKNIPEDLKHGLTHESIKDQKILKPVNLYITSPTNSHYNSNSVSPNAINLMKIRKSKSFLDSVYAT